MISRLAMLTSKEDLVAYIIAFENLHISLHVSSSARTWPMLARAQLTPSVLFNLTIEHNIIANARPTFHNEIGCLHICLDLSEATTR